MMYFPPGPSKMVTAAYFFFLRRSMERKTPSISSSSVLYFLFTSRFTLFPSSSTLG
eukprot:CAMPEP_0172528820 /NCGR_PEP_ID=MMETSP1067-20121228/3071_1 /TAXON_ID=265564 ORGANISM="Thalassiosira punctigera, Strain Tpunct2005C2" /NCGR_SAMPLE_ID=MMETSP1067 /ASSEMBLY_ACC=CAM_ASM_000444 /LENGTH=55 /DNA_ID=CAMNT_0013312785 /DNA_START=13 /DNA_END=177 /DNA_ORIENTATION=+